MRSVGPRRTVFIYIIHSGLPTGRSPYGRGPWDRGGLRLYGFCDFCQLAGGFDGADEGWRDVFFFQGLADETAEDDAFVAVEPGEIIDI